MCYKCFVIFLLLFQYLEAISQHPLLIIVSYDAFRYNYFLKNTTPYLAKLKSQGTTADYLQNVFPTKTFPNHHSIATGVYPEVHGVVGNEFYDPQLKRIIKIERDMFNFNEDVLPIWTINEMAGKGRHSGVMMWPGSSFSYKGVNATYSYAYDNELSKYQRIDIVMSWILNKSKPANLIMLYIEEPDSHGHVFGPESPEVHNWLHNLDNITAYLHEKLRENSLTAQTNVIHVSDHGMMTVKPPNFINLTEYLQPDTYIRTESSPCAHFIPNKGFEEDVYSRLKKASLQIKHFKVYKKSEMLPRWHFSKNRRIPPVFAVAEPGYAFDDMYELSQYFAEKYHFVVTPNSQFGVHGYDNEIADMHPYFIAIGPAVKQKHKVPPFSTLDLYSLFCAILDLKAGANNGTFANVRDILQPVKHQYISPVLIAVGGCIITISLIGIIFGIYILCKRKKSRTEFPSAFEKILQENRDIPEVQHLLEEI